jgi:diguanylate cyclase (GGDEF)-like protein
LRGGGSAPSSGPPGAAPAAEWRGDDGTLRGLLDASSDWINILDFGGRILFVNDSARKALGGGSIAGGPGDNWIGLWQGEWQALAAGAVKAAAAEGAARLTISRLQASGGIGWWDIALSRLPCSDGGPPRLAVIARDVTAQKLAEEQLAWAANHDPVTMLPNRTLFQQRLDEEIAKAEASGASFGLLLLDLDGFRWTNETLGLESGDAAMREITTRLRAGLRRDDIIARLGDEQFGLILSGIAAADHLLAAAEPIFDRLGEPFLYGGKRWECQATMGASIFPEHGPTRLDLTNNADTALHAAKETGRGTLQVFEAAMRCEMQRRDSMLSVARHALRENRVMPFYQAKVDLRDGSLYGFEALLRWHHPSFGIQLPDTIQAAFQDDRLAAAISDRMIGLVLRDMRGWLDRGIDFGHVAVNAAAAEFRRGDFAERLLGQLHAAGMPPALLQLEVTETVFLGLGSEHVLRALQTMSAAGIGIALDDFGTGYASLSHLKQFPVSTIKIDRSFIRNLHEDAGDEAIVRAVVSLGGSLGINVVAEGIETPAQSAYLRKHRCAYGQGYLFGAAEAAADIPARIEQFDRHAYGEAMASGVDHAATMCRDDAADSPVRRNIYVVDDDREVRDSTVVMLQTLGHRCRSFASGADFLAAVLHLQPGCILLDIRMGGLNGLQVLRELRWMKLSWPVIVISGEPSDSLAQSARAAGALALLGKPYDEFRLPTLLAGAFLELDEAAATAAAPAAFTCP